MNEFFLKQQTILLQAADCIEYLPNVHTLRESGTILCLALFQKKNSNIITKLINTVRNATIIFKGAMCENYPIIYFREILFSEIIV